MSKPSQFSLKEGEWIGGTPYRVVRPLGLGGMGEVYEVDHTRAGTRRAIKVVREATGAAGDAARRLTREGRALAAIDHPNVVRVYEVGTIADGRPYFAMQLLEGMTVRALVAGGGRIEVRRAAGIVLQALAGLEVVHAHGIVHRDLKPTNLFLYRDETVKVLDFGVAKLLHGATVSTSTAEGMVLGTMRYMAPEQLTGAPVSYAADLYAMGLVLFELVAGQPAFASRARGHGPVLARLRDPAPRLSAVVPEVSAALDEVMVTALAREPSDRFGSAAEFAEHLRAAVLGARTSSGYPAPALRSSTLDWSEGDDEDAAEPTRLWCPPACRGSAPPELPVRPSRWAMAASTCSLVLAGIAAAVAIATAVTRTTWGSGSEAPSAGNVQMRAAPR